MPGVRIVLDTNVVVSALLWRGTSYQLLAALRQRAPLQLFSSTALVEELAEVLARPFAIERLALLGKTASAVLADYLEAVELVEPLSVPQVVLRDPDDDQVIAAALTAHAEVIVSGDADLLTLGHYHDIAILSAAQCLQRLG
ncbi:MAG: putative toxin-antitoxin system toxin component, PIN family [Gammaproteobacteria bacterium]